jgi:Xaa-Pro aminopeptidase
MAARILKNTEQKLRPGTICEDLYKSAIVEAESAGLSMYYMGYGADQVTFLGHGIGLEIDELPVLAQGFTTPLVLEWLSRSSLSSPSPVVELLELRTLMPFPRMGMRS